MSVSLSIDAVNVTLGGNHILKDVSLTVEPGEFVTLLGASGSGKSTLLNVIAGLQRLDSGHVRFSGRNMESVPPRNRGVGVVFQSYALFPQLTVAENIAFPLRAAGRPRSEQKEVASEMLALVKLARMESRHPASLSGGQRQRVALARALAASPSVLLLDEPMAALDKQLREQMQVEISRIQRQVGTTTVAVTHDQTEAFTMSDRVAIMRDGRFVQIDTPERLYRRPVDEYVAKFLGEANLFGSDGDRLLDRYHQAGVRTTAVVRPEDLTPLPPGASAAQEVAAIVELVSFQGERFRVEAMTTAGMRIISTVPGHTDMSGVRPGEHVRFGVVDPARVHHIARGETPAEPFVAA